MINAAIVGGTGYTGVELIRLLNQHPDVSIKIITSRGEAGQAVWRVFPNLYPLPLNYEAPDINRLSECDVVFFATPHGIAMNMAQQLLQANVRVIDLAADFRLQDLNLWQQWYGMEHQCPELVKDAVYGFPEQNRQQIASARLLGNPGCYPTASGLALLPLLEQIQLAPQTIIIDAKSGVSGAGRKSSVANLLCESSENLKAYAVAGHRHGPEIDQILTKASGKSVSFQFTPHLIPMIRGMLATVYVQCDQSIEKIRDIYQQRYEQETFVSVLPEGIVPETRSLRASNHCHISLNKNGNTLIILSAIDNLCKGAAGQAVQNMNIMFGIEESLGISNLGLFL